MQPIHLFDLAAKQMNWLSIDQGVVAGNVSNANTPGYRAQNVKPFAEVLDKTGLQMVSTSPSHLGFDPEVQRDATIKDENPWETTDSGNTVSLEQEMLKAGDVNRAYSLNTSLVKAFHGMLMASVRS